MRRRLRFRAWRRRRDLSCVADRTGLISPDAHLCFVTLRNEFARLPYFLDYYRDLGIDHFIMVDNASTDGSRAFLADQPDVSLWTTGASYRDARFGMDWITWLQGRYAQGHWTLTVDPDEFLVYPFCDTRPLRALTDWLDAGKARSFAAMLIDMYPRNAAAPGSYLPGDDPVAAAPWFDSGNYTITRNPRYRNLWIQGGPRARSFFADRPAQAPALNKIPLVKWDRRYAYVSATHMLLPRGLNLTYDRAGGEKASGALLHTKFIGTLEAKSHEEIARGQHYAGSAEYRAYVRPPGDAPDMWSARSERYINWRQLEHLGLMSKGHWA